MPRFLRIFLTLISFVMFFVLSLVIGTVLFPVAFLFALGNVETHRDRCSRAVAWGYGTFLLWMKLAGLIAWEKIEFPEELKGQPYVVVANHPTLIDVLFLLHYFPGLTCVVKGTWYRNPFWTALLRSTNYLPGPLPSETSDERIFQRMVDHVKSGHPLLMFPEGTRSKARELHKFKRGAFEVAKRTGVPLIPVVIRVDRPILMKGVPFWSVPKQHARWEFDVLDPIDTQTDTRNGKQLCRELEADIGRRFDIWVEERERLGTFPSEEPETAEA